MLHKLFVLFKPSSTLLQHSNTLQDSFVLFCNLYLLLYSLFALQNAYVLYNISKVLFNSVDALWHPKVLLNCLYVLFKYAKGAIKCQHTMISVICTITQPFNITLSFSRPTKPYKIKCTIWCFICATGYIVCTKNFRCTIGTYGCTMISSYALFCY